MTKYVELSGSWPKSLMSMMCGLPMALAARASWRNRSVSSVSLRHLAAKDLDRHLLVDDLVTPRVDDPHPSLAEQPLDQVAAVDGLADVGIHLGRGRRPGHQGVQGVHGFGGAEGHCRGRLRTGGGLGGRGRGTGGFEASLIPLLAKNTAKYTKGCNESPSNKQARGQPANSQAFCGVQNGRGPQLFQVRSGLLRSPQEYLDEATGSIGRGSVILPAVRGPLPSWAIPLTVALRYLASKKRNMVSISTALAVGGVLLGVAALTIVMSVTGGFQEQFREKVLGVNAHVLVLKYSIDFREYRDVMKKVEGDAARDGGRALRHQPDDGDPRRPHRHGRAAQGRRPGAHADGPRPAQAHRRGQPRRGCAGRARSRRSARPTR